jgi:hypothetical protein
MLFGGDKWFQKRKCMIANWLLRLIHIIDISVGNKAKEILIVNNRKMGYPENFHPVQGSLA